MLNWKKLKEEAPKQNQKIEAKVRHCNPELLLPDRIVSGFMGDDNFYLSCGGEMSFNWDILEWRELKEK